MSQNIEETNRLASSKSVKRWRWSDLKLALTWASTESHILKSFPNPLNRMCPASFTEFYPFHSPLFAPLTHSQAKRFFYMHFLMILWSGGCSILRVTHKISFACTILLFTCFSLGLDCTFVLSFSPSTSYKHVHREITLEWTFRPLSSLAGHLFSACFRCFAVCVCGRWVWLSLSLWPIVGFVQHIWRI